MQSMYGKLRLVAKQTSNSFRFSSTELKSNSLLCGTRTAFSPDKNCGRQTSKPASSKRYGLASVLPSYGGPGRSSSLDRSTAIVSTWPTSNITTSTFTYKDAYASSPDVPQRVKFKRLDKTARHIMQIIDKEAVEEVKANREIPDIKPGYIVQLEVEVPENKRRVSIIKGIVIARCNAGVNTTFRIRRLVSGVGIESLFPLYSPNINEIKVVDKKKVRRAKLYYLRDKMNPLRKQ